MSVKLRTCLGRCGKEFLSESAGNRFCPQCRGELSRVGGMPRFVHATSGFSLPNQHRKMAQNRVDQ